MYSTLSIGIHCCVLILFYLRRLVFRPSFTNCICLACIRRTVFDKPYSWSADVRSPFHLTHRYYLSELQYVSYRYSANAFSQQYTPVDDGRLMMLKEQQYVTPKKTQSLYERVPTHTLRICYNKQCGNSMYYSYYRRICYDWFFFWLNVTWNSLCVVVFETKLFFDLQHKLMFNPFNYRYEWLRNVSSLIYWIVHDIFIGMLISSDNNRLEYSLWSLLYQLESGTLSN